MTDAGKKTSSKLLPGSSPSIGKIKGIGDIVRERGQLSIARHSPRFACKVNGRFRILNRGMSDSHFKT